MSSLRLQIVMTALAAFVLHLVLGWAWTLLAGVGAGVWAGRRGWRVGGVAVGLEWLVLVGYNYVVAPAETGAMLETMGGIVGNMPGFAIVAISLLIGVLLGALGGLIGTQLRRLVRP